MSVAIYGVNAVKAALNAGEAKQVFVLSDRPRKDISDLAKAKGVAVRQVGAKEFSRLVSSPNSQGVAALVDPIPLYSLQELIAASRKKAYPLLLLLDGIEDPHNLGAIVRTADAFGVDGIVLKKRGEAPLNGTVAKVSTGAIHFVKVATVSNLSQAIQTLKDAGFWIVSSADKGAVPYTDVDYRSPIALVVGNEGKGISRLVLDRSDFVVRIPMHGEVNCLNASVATGVLLANIVAQRG